MSWSINQNKCVWSQVVESTSTATSRWSRCMTRVLREASVANIARLRAVTEQTHTCINTPPSALHLVWVFHIGAVLTCMWELCDQHLKGDKEHRFISGQVNAIKTSTISYSIVSTRHCGDVQRCFWESAGAAIWANANRGCEWALTILTSQIIPCLPQQQCWPAALSVNRASWIPPRPICLLQALAPIWKKMREQCDQCEDTFLSATSPNYHMSKQHNRMSIRASVWTHFIRQTCH